MRLDSLSLFVGTSECNGKCSHCAGTPLRKYAPTDDGVIDKDLIYKTIKDCYERGARYLSLSSSGEPTLSPLSVTKVLKLIYESKKEGIEFSPINMYSNGILIGEDKNFCDRYLSLWKDYGLTTLYITIHDADKRKNAKAYGIRSYPSLVDIVDRIHDANLLMRANLMLSRKTISSADKFISTVQYLKEIGIDAISAWPIRGMDDKIDPKLSLSDDELDEIGNWIMKQGSAYKIRLLQEKSQTEYKKINKLTLFPDGTLSDTWCNQ